MSLTAKIIDFNVVKPEGFEKKIRFAKYINFNGWTLKNLHSTASTAIIITSNSKISNLTIENFYFLPSTSGGGQLIEMDGSGGVTLTNCIISGAAELPRNIITTFLDGCALHECAINVIVNDIYGSFSLFTSCQNSDIVVDLSSNSEISSISSFEICRNKIVNSRISGRINSNATNEISIGDEASAYNVFNLQANKPLKYLGKGITVYNKDTAESSETSSAEFIGCSESDLKNAEYLNSLRFPIGVVDENE